MKISFQKLFYVIATVIAIFAILVLAKSILIPLGIALLMSFILFPLARKFEKWGVKRILAAFLSIFVVVLMVGAVISFFSSQIVELSNEFANFQDKIILAFADVTLYIDKHVGFIHLEKNELFGRMKGWLSESTGSLVMNSINSTASFLSGLLGAVVFTFLILIYRKGLTEAFVGFFPVEKKEQVLKMFKSVQHVGQDYLLGMLLTTILIGLANSIGLWIIGIDNPFLFGFLGATLSIIPYIGTISGAIIPILYAFATNNSGWMMVSVAVLFWAVQLISDNFLTPKIVGGSLKINALASILSLIIGAVVWGVIGMILFLPFVAMLKVVCEEYDDLKPVALLLASQDDDKKDDSGKFMSAWFKKTGSWFSKRNTTHKKSSKAKPTTNEEL